MPSVRIRKDKVFLENNGVEWLDYIRETILGKRNKIFKDEIKSDKTSQYNNELSKSEIWASVFVEKAALTIIAFLALAISFRILHLVFSLRKMTPAKKSEKRKYEAKVEKPLLQQTLDNAYTSAATLLAAPQSPTPMDTSDQRNSSQADVAILASFAEVVEECDVPEPDHLNQERTPFLVSSLHGNEIINTAQQLSSAIVFEPQIRSLTNLAKTVQSHKVKKSKAPKKSEMLEYKMTKSDEEMKTDKDEEKLAKIEKQEDERKPHQPDRVVTDVAEVVAIAMETIKTISLAATKKAEEISLNLTEAETQPRQEEQFNESAQSNKYSESQIREPEIKDMNTIDLSQKEELHDMRNENDKTVSEAELESIDEEIDEERNDERAKKGTKTSFFANLFRPCIGMRTCASRRESIDSNETSKEDDYDSYDEISAISSDK